VVTVHYNVSAIDGDYSASTYGTVGYTEQPDGEYTPYDELTEEQVLGWVTPTISAEQLADMEAGIAGDIDWQIQQASANNPVTPPLPWPVNPPVAAE
jgi:hypothetical protein